jgi:hypothetical protein
VQTQDRVAEITDLVADTGTITHRVAWEPDQAFEA